MKRLNRRGFLRAASVSGVGLALAARAADGMAPAGEPVVTTQVAIEHRVAAETAELVGNYASLPELDLLEFESFADTTHEIRTAISNVRLYTRLLQVGNPVGRKHYEEMVESTIDHLDQLTANLSIRLRQWSPTTSRRSLSLETATKS